MNQKILSQKKIVNVVQSLNDLGKRLVVVNGSFDIMHIGHVKLFKAAKRYGDVFIVLINSDESIKKYKGPNRPIIREENRAEMVVAVSSVDYVVLFDEFNPKNIINKIKPDVYCNCSDWGKYCIEREVVEVGGGKVVIINRKKSDIITTEIIKLIFQVYSKKQSRAIFIDRDRTTNNKKIGYTHKIKDFNYLPGVINALKRLSKTDYKIIIITNQSGIGRGYYTKKAYEKLTQFILADLHLKKIRIDKVYFCPHHPDDNCSCRKPRVGLLLKAVNDFRISLSDSWIIGDDSCDVVMGREANVKTIKIGKLNKRTKIKPNFIVSGLSDAVKIILKKINYQYD